MSAEAAELVERIRKSDIRWVRTDSVVPDGPVVGKHLSARKFAGALPAGTAISEIALGLDLGGAPYLGWWNDWRPQALGDIVQRPDPSTFVELPDQPGTAAVFCDLATTSGEDLPICPRSLLRRLDGDLTRRGLAAKAAFEIEAMLFDEPVAIGRRRHWRAPTPMSLAAPLGYLHQNTRMQRRYLDAVLIRLDRLGVPIEGFHDEAAPGQIELNLDPAGLVTAADHVVRVKQTMRDVAVEQGCSVTFMAKPGPDYGNGLHVHHSLVRDGESLFHAPGNRLHPDGQAWLGGLIGSLPAAVSILAPTINSYRRMVGFAAAPTVASWGFDDKSAAIRVVGAKPSSARIECRVAGGDANPYLVLAAVVASGLVGLDARLEPPPPLSVAGWGLPPEGYPHLPASITASAAALRADERFQAVLGEAFCRHWLLTRDWEWLMFHTTGGDPASPLTDWELDRYFEVV